MDQIIKYVVCGGYVTSKNDGDEHYISARRLRELYKLHPSECILVDNDENFKLLGFKTSKLQFLYPRYDGNYTL